MGTKISHRERSIIVAAIGRDTGLQEETGRSCSFKRGKYKENPRLILTIMEGELNEVFAKDCFGLAMYREIEEFYRSSKG